MTDRMEVALAAMSEQSGPAHYDEPTRQRSHSECDVIAEIQRLATVAPRAVQRRQAWLYGAAVRRFGTWRAAVRAAGINYDEALGRRAPGTWSREKVIEGVRRLEDKASSYVRRRDRGLYNAALRLFGSWEAAVTQAGYPYSEIYRGWIPVDSFGLRYARRSA